MNHFSDKSTTALNLSVESARQLGHAYVGTEHLLLGLLKTADSVAAAVLEENNVTAEYVLNKIVESVGSGTPTNVSGNDLTPRMKRIIEQSAREAAQMGRKVVGTEHLLIALLRERDCEALRIIASVADPKEIYNSILKAMNIQPSNGEKYRVRKRGASGNYIYFHTIKRFISGFKRVEEEKIFK